SSLGQFKMFISVPVALGLQTVNHSQEIVNLSLLLSFISSDIIKKHYSILTFFDKFLKDPFLLTTPLIKCYTTVLCITFKIVSTSQDKYAKATHEICTKHVLEESYCILILCSETPTKADDQKESVVSPRVGSHGLLHRLDNQLHCSFVVESSISNTRAINHL
ncbi:hypothetical protein EGW08_012982, partial [Elysia chlorotica]